MWGKSILEYGGDMKCSIDKQGFCFLFGSCKPDECTPKTEYETNNVAIQQLINNGCIVYYDGCNRCTVDKSNGQSMCTLRGCSEMDKPKCIEYKKY